MIKTSDINWKKMEGMVPAVVQDLHTGDVLMLGYMNEAAVDQTLSTGKVTFYSRSKQRLWVKGESSGHFLLMETISKDCDDDAILIKARPQGPTCHKGVTSCFTGDIGSSLGFLGRLNELIRKRKEDMPEGSYTTSLFTEGINRMAQKVGEEGVEVALASKDDDQEAFIGECADLFYHTIVLARAKGLGLQDICDKLKQRHS